jgi:hypothetical protein
MDTTTKFCPRCKKYLPLIEFNKCKSRKDGLNAYCKHCCKQWREENKLALAAKKKEYYSRPDIVVREKESRRQRHQKLKEVRREKTVKLYSTLEGRKQRHLNQIKQRCKDRGEVFDLTLEDITIPKQCPYLGIELTTELGKGMLLSNTSVDRIDPTKGYVRGNIQIISLLANQMKNCANRDQLITFAKNILKIHGENNEV